MKLALVREPDAVGRLEAEMLKLPQASCNVRHIFVPGLYIRELTMPAGTFAIGHKQRAPHLNIVLRGIVRIRNDDGSWATLEAPLTLVGEPGQKVGYVVEEVVWLNVYATDETDIEKLEETYLEKSESFVSHHSRQEMLARRDFPKMLRDLGVSAQLVHEETHQDGDLIPFPPGIYKCKIGRSHIHGKGLIATSDLVPGEVICAARIWDKRTPAGRYTNHSGEPNAVMMRDEKSGNIVLVAVKAIEGCRGGRDGEEITVDYRAHQHLRVLP